MATWMLVEDEPDLFDTLIALFEIWSVNGVAFTNGSDAIQWIEEVEKGGVDVAIPELALLDIRLPGASGPDIGQRLRASRALKDIAIVLTTAYHLSPQEEKEVITRAGADAVLYKPLPSPAEFRAVLERTIEQRAAKRAAAEPAQDAEPAKPAGPTGDAGRPEPVPEPAAELAPKKEQPKPPKNQKLKVQAENAEKREPE